MTLSLKTHIKSKPKRGSGEAILQRVNPYVRLTVKGNPPVFIQGGQFFSEGGAAIKAVDLPDWVDEEVAKMTPEARQEIGLKV